MIIFSDELLPIQLNYGIVVLDLDDVDDDGVSPVLHFVGLANEPDGDDMSLALSDFIDSHPQYDDESLMVQLADDEVIEIYKNEYLSWLSERN